MIDPNDGVSDDDELEVIEPYTSIAAVWLVLEMGKWGVTPRHGVKQTKTADLRGDKPFGDTGDCKASIRALHQMHHAANVRHPIAVGHQRLLSCPHVRPHSGRCPVCTAEAQGSTRSTSVQIVDYR